MAPPLLCPLSGLAFLPACLRGLSWVGLCPEIPHNTSTEQGLSLDQVAPDPRRARACGVAVGKDGETQ